MTFKINPQNLDFDLPSELIAQEPPARRAEAHLMALDRGAHKISHHKFSDLNQFLEKGDGLVLNKTKVNRAKFFGKKKTGGRAEIIFMDEVDPGKKWRALIRPQMNPGAIFDIAPACSVVVENRFPSGEYVVRPENFHLSQLIQEKGLMPLPPYIKRSENDLRNPQDVENYQTVFAKVPGSIAAPTAALHFTGELLEKISSAGVEIIEIVLHVGWGTFRPVAGTIDAHQMLPEKYEVEKENLERLYELKKQNRRIIGVGTTVTRFLESLPEKVGDVSLSGETNLFIKPGFKFRWINGLITNFHVPRSTPIALASAFAGLDLLTAAYDEAIKQQYRFFSYGDAMLIL